MFFLALVPLPAVQRGHTSKYKGQECGTIGDHGHVSRRPMFDGYVGGM